VIEPVLDESFDWADYKRRSLAGAARDKWFHLRHVFYLHTQQQSSTRYQHFNICTQYSFYI